MPFLMRPEFILADAGGKAVSGNHASLRSLAMIQLSANTVFVLVASTILLAGLNLLTFA